MIIFWGTQFWDIPNFQYGSKPFSMGQNISKHSSTPKLMFIALKHGRKHSSTLVNTKSCAKYKNVPCPQKWINMLEKVGLSIPRSSWSSLQTLMTPLNRCMRCSRPSYAFLMSSCGTQRGATVISPWDFMSSIEFNMAILEPPSETVNKTCGRHVANCLRALYGFIWLSMALWCSNYVWCFQAIRIIIPNELMKGI